MFLFQPGIIALLIIGSQRSLASPTSERIEIEEGSFSISNSLSTSTVHPLQDESSVNPREPYNMPQASQKTGGEGQKYNWDCQNESDFIQKQIALTSKMLSDGEKALKKQKELSADDIVLVLGKAGSGKTSLVQYLTQNPKLQSKMVISADTGEYIIEDGEKIGTSATESFTLYPELVNYNSSLTFCDSPGFHDSRSSAHEVVSMDFMKTTISRFKRVKILLLENYSSLQYGLYKDNFIDTLRHLNDLLVDIDRYKDHIVLIATKLPFTFKMTADNNGMTSKLITEEMHIESILEYLNHTESSIAEKLDLDIGKSKKDFYRKAIKLLQSLQTRDESGKAARVNVFRRPYNSGPLTGMSLLEKNKESLTKTIMHLDYVDVEKNDFDFTLSNEAKMYLECLLKLTSDNYKNKINQLSFKLNEFITEKSQNYTSNQQVLSDLETLQDNLKHLSDNLDETKNYNAFFEKVNSFVSEQEISSHINYNDQIHVLEKYEELLLKFVDTSLLFTPSSWTLPIRQVRKFAENELNWHKSLNKFISGLASYNTQKNKTDIFSTVFHEGSTSINDLMNLFAGITGNTDFVQVRDALDNTKKRFEVEHITKALLKQSEINCDNNGRLVVKGFQIRIAEINSHHLLHHYCNNITVKEVAFLAIDTVFLDEDTVDSFRGVNMFIAAPKWEVIGQRRIVLSGQQGPEISADDDSDPFQQDGKPGLPGGNGGSFFGIGLYFFNGDNLYIELDGGKGGSGSDGKKGRTGNNGKNAEFYFGLGLLGYSSVSSTFDFPVGTETYSLENSLLNANENIFLISQCHKSYRGVYDISTKIQVVVQEGRCGSDGYEGGQGGESGIGGNAGNMQLIELGDSAQIKVQNQTGSLGTRGKKGENGDRGEDGVGMICVQVEGFEDKNKVKNYWKCESTNETSAACKTCKACSNLDENQDYSYVQDGIQQPAPKTSPDFIHYLLDYAILLEQHSNHTIFKKIITDFKEAIQRKFSYNLNEIGLLYFKKLV